MSELFPALVHSDTHLKHVSKCHCLFAIRLINIIW